MAKYRIPIEAISYTEVEADNLADAIADVCKGTPDVEGVNLYEVDNWGVSLYDSIFKDGEELIEEETDEYIYLSDIPNNEIDQY